MNLIERLDGYENAKERGKRENVLDDHDFNYIQKALLQHRRVHGIFEVGDWVFYTGRANDADMYRLKEVYKEHGFVVGSNGTDKDFWTLFIEEIRHATDEEIKANERLEVGNAN